MVTGIDDEWSLAPSLALERGVSVRFWPLKRRERVSTRALSDF
jgi:hypothetical protein